MRRISLLAPLFAAVLIALPFLPAYAFDALSIGDRGAIVGAFADDDNYFYILSNYKDNYRITVIDPARSAATLDPDVPVSETPFAYSRGCFYFFRSCAELEGGSVFRYSTVRCADCKTTVVTTKVINGADQLLSGEFACDGERYYIPTASSLCVYSEKCLLESETLLYCRGAMSCSTDGSVVYCPCTEGLAVISGSVSYRPIETSRVYPFGEWFSDDASVIYDKTGGSAVCTCFEPSNGTARLGEYFVGVIGGRLTAVREDERRDLGSIPDGAYICGCGDVCAVFTQSGSSVNVRFVTQDDFPPEEAPSSETESAVHAEAPHFSDGTYIFVSEGQTVAAFRRENGLPAAEFRKPNGERADGGVLGTGMTAILPDGEYTVVVPGDLTGEGSVNSRDAKAAEEHLLSIAPLEGARLAAADINRDGKTDLADAAEMYRKN